MASPDVNRHFNVSFFEESYKEDAQNLNVKAPTLEISSDTSMSNLDFSKVVTKRLFDILIEKSCDGFEREICWDDAQSKFSELSQIPEDILGDLYNDLKTQIRIMDEKVDDAQQILQQFKGKICEVSLGLTDKLSKCQPSGYHYAKVADFNDNLSYAMQERGGLLNIFQRCEYFGTIDEGENTVLQSEISKFEEALKAAVGGKDDMEYQGSFMRTEKTIPQPPHVDFNWDVLEQKKEKMYIGFFPLTSEGMFIQLWENKDSMECEYGEILFIPHGKLLLVPSDTIHGGGFKSGNTGNLRFHLYIGTESNILPDHQNNRYTEKDDRTQELSNRFKDSYGLQNLIGPLFDI